MFSLEQAKQFCETWLPAWTGNQPEKLADFYAEDAFYSDPAVRKGLKGRPAILKYFKQLLAYNPHWTWTHLKGIPLEKGFLNHWLARIPVKDQVIECVGVCSVQFNTEGLIQRNEVYFDRTELMAAIRENSLK